MKNQTIGEHVNEQTLLCSPTCSSPFPSFASLYDTRKIASNICIRDFFAYILKVATS